jgi:hypothetical protein
MVYDLPLRDRLRIHAGTAPDLHCQLMLKAADEIEMLTAQLVNVRAVVQAMEAQLREGAA